IWAILIGACVTMALPHLLVGIWQRRAADLFFAVVAIAVIGVASAELVMMRAKSIDEFALALRWAHLPLFVLTIGLVGFVRFYFGTGRIWLGATVCIVRLVALIINFTVRPNINFTEITALQSVPFFGENVSAPLGMISPWNHLGELT